MEDIIISYSAENLSGGQVGVEKQDTKTGFGT